MSKNWWEQFNPVGQSPAGSSEEKKNWFESYDIVGSSPLSSTEQKKQETSFEDLFGAPMSPQTAEAYKAATMLPGEAAFIVGKGAAKAAVNPDTYKNLTKTIPEMFGQAFTSSKLQNADSLPDSIMTPIPSLAVDTPSQAMEFWKSFGVTNDEELRRYKQELQKSSLQEISASRERVRELTPKNLDIYQQGIRGGIESGAIMAPGAALSLVTKSSVPALAAAGAIEGFSGYGEARLEGKSAGAALAYGGINGLIEVATELAPTGKLLDALGASSVSGLKKKLLEFAGSEILTEQAATALQSLNGVMFGLDEELANAKDIGEIARIQAERQAVTAISTIVAGGAQAGAVGAINRLQEEAIRRNIESETRDIEGVGSALERERIMEIRRKALDDAKAIAAPPIEQMGVAQGQQPDDAQFGAAYANRIFESVGNYVPEDAEFKVETKDADGIERYVVVDQKGRQFGKDLSSKSQATALSEGLNNTAKERAKVLAQLRPVQDSLQKTLEGFGLNDIGLSIDRRVFNREGQALTSEGLFDPVVRQVFLAVDAIDPDGTLTTDQRRDALKGVLRHEVVHALRYLDLWKKSEWKNLENAAATVIKPGTDKTYLQIAQENYADQSDVIKAEESVSELIRDVAGRQSNIAGKPRSLSERAINFFDKAKNAITGSGFQTYEDIVQRFERGDIGARERGRIRTYRATEERMSEAGVNPQRIQQLFSNAAARNQAREKIAQDISGGQPPANPIDAEAIRINAIRESRSVIDPVPPTIEVDGKEFPTVDFNGKQIYSGYEGEDIYGFPILPTMQGLKNFWKNFKNSKAVDELGRPLTWLHGTARDILSFKPKQADATFLTLRPSFADDFTKMSEGYMFENFPEFVSDEDLEAIAKELLGIAKENKKLSTRKSIDIDDNWSRLWAASGVDWLKNQAAEDVSTLEYLSSGIRSDIVANRPVRASHIRILKDIAYGRNTVLSQKQRRDVISKRMPTGPNIMPVYANIEDPFDYKDPASIKRLADKWNEMFPSKIEEGNILSQILEGRWDAIEGTAVIKAIKAAGFDSFYVVEDGVRNLGIFNPNNIKSAIGNDGNFDVYKPSIRESRVGFSGRPDQVVTPEFKGWFRDSKTVDRRGEPIVLYTGTSKDFDFKAFKIPKRGAWFSTSPSHASGFAIQNDSQRMVRDQEKGPWSYKEINTSSRVIPVYLRAENPKVYEGSELRDEVFKRGKENYARGEGMLFDELRMQGYDSVRLKSDDGYDTWVVLDSPSQIKSAISNTGAFSEASGIRESRVAPRSTVSLFQMEGSEARKQLGLSPGINLTRLVGERLNQNTIDSFGKIDDADTSDQASKTIADAMVSEIVHQINSSSQTGTGTGWYSENYPRALKALSRRFPELSTDPSARSLFTAIVAITSNGEDVSKNIDNAIKIYSGARSGKRISNLYLPTRRSDSLRDNLQILDSLIEKHGIDGFTSVLTQEMSVADINAELRRQGEKPDSSYTADTIMPRAALYFGPKLGAFYANLMGAEGYLTMDLWWSRMFNRIRGTLVPKPTQSSIDNVRKMLVSIGRLPPDYVPGIARPSDDDVIEAAVPFWESAKRKGYKNTTALEKAANTLIKNARLELEESPFRASDRGFMIKTTRLAQNILARRGVNLSLADIQAALWYYEKRLYGKLTGRSTDDIGYEEAILRAAETARPERSAPRFYRGAGRGAVPGREGVQVGQPVSDVGIPAARESRVGSEQPGVRGGRDQGGAIAPLEGAPNVLGGGPIPEIVAAAENYAAQRGLPYSRQPSYVRVDEGRATRIADAYEQMANDPTDSKVIEAYRDLIDQTRAQYDALVDAGYTFTFFDSSTDPYGGNPWNAMRDLRSNKSMAVYGTYEGFGTEGITASAIANNPLLQDTGLRWKDQGGTDRMVTANDLFRAVHDAFGHGIEGAGFRPQGEENAWQAHARLFTGPALAALTSETRGQNSWLNFNPKPLREMVGDERAKALHPDNWETITTGEHNRTAKVEDTIFAEQKAGLMPDWTWQEGIDLATPRARESRNIPPDLDRLNAEGWTSTGDIKSVDSNDERSISLRTEIKKAKRLLDKGVIDETEFASRVSKILERSKKVEFVKDYLRGADIVKEKLIVASRRGEISKEGANLAIWFIDKNPAVADDLAISIRLGQPTIPGKPVAQGTYGPSQRIITIFKFLEPGFQNPIVAVHEIMHHLERMMPPDIRADIFKSFALQLSHAQKNAPQGTAMHEALTHLVDYHFNFNAASYAKAREAMNRLQDGSFASLYQYTNPSEFWAVNSSRIMQGRYGVSKSTIGKIKLWLKEFIEKIKDMFGLRSDAPIIRGLESIMKGDGKFQPYARLLVEESSKMIPFIPRERQSVVPGPSSDSDGTSAAEALNDGEPINSMGNPTGPRIISTAPDATVDISDAKLDSITSRLLTGVEFIQSASDKLRGGVGLEELAWRVENYYDSFNSRLGIANGIIRDSYKNIEMFGKDAATKTFELYIRERENKRYQEARDIYINATESERALIDAWDKIAEVTGDINLSIRTPEGEPMKVWDAQINSWRPIRAVRDFFPRSLKRDVLMVMKNPDIDPVLWDQLLDALVDDGRVADRDEAKDYLIRQYFADEVKQDYFAGVEKARAEPLPEIFYDYSWDAATRYIRKWARRTSQIENFGQETSQFKKEWFGRSIPKIRDEETQNYVAAIRDRVYEVEDFDVISNMMNWANSLATGLQLGNWVSSGMNLLGGMTTNVQEFGLVDASKAFVELMKDWKNIQNQGTHLGVLNKDFINILNDNVERDGNRYWSQGETVSEGLAKFASFMLTYSGYNAAENAVRSVAFVAARANLMKSLDAINNKPGSAVAKKFVEWVNRQNLSLDALMSEDGAGPETEKYIRRAVNVPQGSYDITMTPVFIDSPFGRFFFKYQKFGTQINRFFYMNFLKPFVTNPTPRNLMSAVGFVATGIVGGGIALALRDALGYGDAGPDEEEIEKALKNKDTARAWALILSRSWQNLIAAGSLGFYGNYAQLAKDWQDQERVKNPMSPPGLASVNAVIDLFARIRDQGMLTAKDLEEIAESTVSYYRAGKRVSLATADAIGIDGKAVRQFSVSKNLREVRELSRRYSSEMEIEFKRSSPAGTPIRTTMTPYNKQIVDALYAGRTDIARTLVMNLKRGKPADEREKIESSVRAAIRNRQPIQIGGSAPSKKERADFLKWAKRNTSAEQYQMILTMDRNYQRSAARIGMGFSGG